jgi:hypothetical protein
MLYLKIIKCNIKCILKSEHNKKFSARFGKTLWPRTGLISMVVDAVAHANLVDDVCLVPVSVSYEHGPPLEQAKFTAALSGRQGPNHDGLLRILGRFLRHILGLDWLLGWKRENGKNLRAVRADVALCFGEPKSLKVYIFLDFLIKR